MRVRIASLMLGAGLLGVGVFYTTEASGGAQIATCSVIRVSGGNFNALTGGQGVASVHVRNLSSRDCTISGHPWIRLGPLRYPITVEDATRAVLGSIAGVPGQVVTLRPRERADAAILLMPGSCGQAKGQVFSLRMRGGWATRSAKLGGLFCKDGSGSIRVGSFRRHS